MPDAGGNEELNVLPGLQILAKGEDLGTPARVELQHFDRVAHVEVEEFIGRESVHLGKGPLFQQIVDSGAERAGAAGKLHRAPAGVGAAEAATFHGVRLKVEQRFDLFSGHSSQMLAASLILDLGAGYDTRMNVQIYTASWCRDCRAAKQFLDSHGIEYTEINVDTDPAASAEVVRRVGKRAIPQMVIDGEWFQPYAPGKGLLLEELHDRFGLVRC